MTAHELGVKEWMSAQAENKRYDAAVKLDILNLTFNERVEWILREMKLLCREDWLEIAHYAGKGGYGFGPMQQLQLRIRHHPLTTEPPLLGVFKGVEGYFKRLIPWPTFKKLAREWSPRGGWEFGRRYYPYQVTDPLIDEWEKSEDINGPDHPTTKAIVRELIRTCVKDYNFNDVITKRPRLSRALRAKLLRDRT